MDVTSAIDEPEIPPNSMESRQLTIAVPPRMRPTSTLQKPIIRSAIPPSVIICAIIMKKGTHMNVKLVMPVDIFWNKFIKGIPR